MNKKILVCTHGRFGEELIKSAQMIGGNAFKNIKAVSLLPSMSMDDYYAAVAKELDKDALSVCFVDLFGGTPCNTVLNLSREYNMEILCGVNMPMLLEVLTMNEDTEIDDLKERCVAAYGSNGFDVLKKLKGE